MLRWGRPETRLPPAAYFTTPIVVWVRSIDPGLGGMYRLRYRACASHRYQHKVFHAETNT